MDSIKFSVIIPVYNVEKYLCQCIESVLSQDYDNYEIILINDGSTDSSEKICKHYTEKYNDKIVYLCQKNKGLSEARNVGIRNATGNYFLFLDSDDYWIIHDFFKILNARLHKHQSDVIILNYKKIFSNSEKVYFSNTYDMPETYFETDSESYVFNKNLWTASAWNKVVNKRLFKNNNLYFTPGITSEDIDWCARLAVVAETFDYLSHPIIAYRQRDNSISNSINYKKIECLKNNIETTYNIVIKSEKKDKLLNFLAYQIATFYFSVSVLNKEEIKNFYNFMDNYKCILKYYNNFKVFLIYIFSKFLGIKITVKILSILNKVL